MTRFDLLTAEGVIRQRVGQFRRAAGAAYSGPKGVSISNCSLLPAQWHIADPKAFLGSEVIICFGVPRTCKNSCVV